MLEGPKAPSETEFEKVLEFLNHTLRPDHNWSIDKEYPTALNLANRHNMNVVVSDNRIVSHAVLKPLIVKSPHMIYKIGAIGSVATHEEFRNQGLSHKILSESLNSARQQNCDVAVLWTNMFDFYRKLGFELGGYEISLSFEKVLPHDTTQYKYSKEKNVSVEAISKVYSQHSVGTIRSQDEFRKFLAIPNTQLYTAWNLNGTLAAYAIEGKGADLSHYIHEWGGSVTAIKNLIGYISHIKNHPFHFIAPRHSGNLLTELKKHADYVNEGYLGMIRITHFEGLAMKLKKAFRNVGVSDFVFEKNNDTILFGCNGDLYTIESEKDLIPLLFGPVDFDHQDIFKPETAQKLKLLLPLPLWIWGWDSV